MPAYDAVITMMGGNVKIADRFLACLFDHGFYIAATKKWHPIKPPGKKKGKSA